MRQLLIESSLKNKSAEFKTNDLISSDKKSLDAGLIEDIFAQEKKRAYDQAYTEATKSVQQEWQDKLNSLQSMLSSIEQPVTIIDDALHQKILEISVKIAEQIIRRELTTDSSQILDIVKQAIELIPNDQHNIVVHIHPNDDIHIKEIIKKADLSDRYQIQHDNSISVGGCKLTTNFSTIDMTVEHQISEIASELLA